MTVELHWCALPKTGYGQSAQNGFFKVPKLMDFVHFISKFANWSKL
jgi:hypothetical protein